MAQRVPRPQPVDRAVSDRDENRVAAHSHQRTVEGHVHHPRAPDVEADDRAGLDARLDHRVPPTRVERRVGQLLGLLGQADRPEPARRVAADLVRGQRRVGEVGDAAGDEAVRPRRDTTPRGTSRSRRARTARPTAGSLHAEYTEPQKPVICDGKLSDAHMPASSMSATRAAGPSIPGRIWSKRTGSIGDSSRSRPTTGVEPDLRVAPSRRTPRSRAASTWSSRRAPDRRARRASGPRRGAPARRGGRPPRSRRGPSRQPVRSASDR